MSSVLPDLDTAALEKAPRVEGEKTKAAIAGGQE